ncbi:hypothetical protein P152DRAFT_447414 [Eremomyces bilateralis CBS 781.70]|uniref:Mid2 domain-containing protein n=1 Tax=Eremomyces bilateralis CBS 781.70 TaxID=1392243 RepID=A0A6G1GAW0_9PEZI|nr:uncharacterized protein P152DRAFT_447414 [Eremomyces bilateralis CBS 781.70]KAF1815164.1 hypothetical protein P152DRAFT_447414 [Eremomyces bilateralis CBS 781.70]
MGAITLHKLSIVCLVSSAVPSAYALATALNAAKHVGLLAERAGDDCGGNATLYHCGNRLPTGFCCSENASCLILNNTITESVLCCPKGSSCEFVETITCDPTEQDATIFPESPLHMANLTNALPSCGNKCCPLGYECTLGACAMKEETKSAPSSSVTAPSPTSSSAVSESSSSTTTLVPVASSGSSFNPSSFAAGLIPGLVLGAALCFGIIWYIRRRKRRESVDSIFGPVRREISDPIHQPSMSTRTDFLQAQQRESNRSSETKSSDGAYSPNTRPGETTPTPRPRYQANTSDPFIQSRTSFPRVRALFAPKTPTVNRPVDPEVEKPSRPGLDRRKSSETIGILMTPPSILPSTRYDPAAQPGTSSEGSGGLRPDYKPRRNIEREIEDGQRMTTFTTIMHDAGCRTVPSDSDDMKRFWKVPTAQPLPSGLCVFDFKRETQPYIPLIPLGLPGC